MKNIRLAQAGVAAALLAGGASLLTPSIASASVRHQRFAASQHTLEVQLTNRASQLTRLGADITAATSLTAAHAATLTANVNTASTNINALVTKVPTDTTQAQLSADRASMYRQNRVFAVLTPQVFQTIEADAIGVEVTSLHTEEPGLLAAVNGLAGENGYANALNHYTALVRLVNTASVDSTNVANSVLAQTPADYPGDTHVFVRANKELLNADIALAHANYDASVVGLATGGYTGA